MQSFFFIIQIENEREIRKNITINIIYELVKIGKKNINCSFSDQINLAFQLTFIEGKKSDMVCHDSATIVPTTLRKG